MTDETPPKKMQISIAYSPDTDDAFMVHALRQRHVDWEEFDFTFTVGDIQELNDAARQGVYDITAISVGAYPNLRDHYLLMPVGASIGDEFGPAIVTRPDSSQRLQDLAGRRIAIPGLNTSAHIAAQCLFGPFTPLPMYFMEIREAVISGRVDAGILIHELQLDPASEGLRKISDLGRLWHDRFRLPLPLGANAIRRSLPAPVIAALTKIYRKSIEVGLANRDSTIASAVHAAAARENLDTTKGDRYISMYVNHRSLEFQDDVLAGIRELFDQGSKLGLFTALDLSENLSTRELGGLHEHTSHC
jgi:1,4-dihydroxy-6-naphthoate synthase